MHPIAYGNHHGKDKTRTASLDELSAHDGMVGSPGGVAPPGSHGSPHERLRSRGSSHPVIQRLVIHCQCVKRVGSRRTTPFTTRGLS